MVLETVAEEKPHEHDNGHKHLHGHHDTQHPHSHSHGHGHKHHHNKHSHGHEHDHDHDKSARGEAKGKDECLKDLTRVGPKAGLLSAGGTISKDGRGVFHDTIDTLRQAEVERTVRHVLQANFCKVSFPWTLLLRTHPGALTTVCDRSMFLNLVNVTP